MKNEVTRPQITLSLFGLVMLGLAWISFSANGQAEVIERTSASSSLRVRPAQGVPGSVADKLQDTGSLQGQGQQGLQSPVGDQLQPNAKTDELNTTPAQP